MPRGPLPWLIALEVLALAALGFAGWHLLAGRLEPATPPPATATINLPQTNASLHASPAPSHAPTPAPSPHGTPVPRPVITPGLSTSTAFWQRNLTQINRDQAAWEQLQMKAVYAVEAFTRAYLQAVVMPAVQDAARRSASP